MTIPREQVILQFMTTLLATGKHHYNELKDIAIELANEYEKAIIVPEKQMVTEKQVKPKDPKFLIGQNILVISSKSCGTITGIRFSTVSGEAEYSVNFYSSIPASFVWLPENDLACMKFNVGQKVKYSITGTIGIIKEISIFGNEVSKMYLVAFNNDCVDWIAEYKLETVEDVVQPDKTISNFSRSQKVLFIDGGIYKTGRIVRVTCSQRDFKVTLCQVEDHLGKRYLVSPDKLTQIKFFVGEPVKHKKSGNFGIIKQVQLNNETMEIEYIIRFVTGDCMYGENDLLSIDES